jgi:3-dehydroquinate dehydratase-2
VASGVNLDLLGRREPGIYGRATLADLEALARSEFAARAELYFAQTNVEAEYLALLDGEWSGAVINPGAWTHTSLALADRLAGLELPFVEVHLSNTAAREAFRHHSYTARLAVGVVQGFGINSYLLGIDGILRYLAASGL